MRVRGILDRLRPAGAPGEATRPGVPVDPRESLANELAPVFAALEPVRQECARITEEAMVAARQREAEAARKAQDIVARARAEGEAERARAAASARAVAARETERILADAQAQAENIRRRGEQDRPQLLSRVLELVRADLRALANGSTGPDPGSAR